MSLSEVSATSQNLSSSSSSKPLFINPFAVGQSVAPNSKAAQRLEKLRDVRSLRTVDKVDRVLSVTADIIGIVIGTHGYEFGGKRTEKVLLLVLDPTAAYTGTEDRFVDKLDAKSGKTTPGDLKIDKARKSLSVPISSVEKFAETFGKWTALGATFKDLEPFHEFRGPCSIDAKLDMKMDEKVEFFQIVQVSVSAFKWLLDTPPPETPRDQIKLPDSVGLSIRIHTMKKIGEANAPMLFRVFVENPQMLGLPVPSLDELKKLDPDQRNAQARKGKVMMVGSKIVSIPVFHDVSAFERRILESDAGGTLGTVSFYLANGSTNAFVHTTKENEKIQKADLLLTLNSWKGDDVFRDIVTMRLWSDALKIYGCCDPNGWGNGLAQALVLQTPMIFNGQVMYTDSEAQMRAKTDPTVRSILTLQATQPLGDMPGTIMLKIGIPVSKAFAMHMALLTKRHGPQSQPTPHPLFIVANGDACAKNMYNNAAESAMIVLNELEPLKRRPVFDDAEAEYLYFAVVGGFIAQDGDRELLAELRVLQRDPTYQGPLGEMLTSKKWKASAPREFELDTYGSTMPPALAVSAEHPCVKSNCRTWAQPASNGVVYFYLYAVSQNKYNQALSSKSSSKFLAITDRKRERTPDVRAASHSTTNGASSTTATTTHDAPNENGGNDDDDIIQPDKDRRTY